MGNVWFGSRVCGGVYFFAFNLKAVLDCNNAFFVFSSFTALKLHSKYSDFRIFQVSVKNCVRKDLFYRSEEIVWVQ